MIQVTATRNNLTRTPTGARTCWLMRSRFWCGRDRRGDRGGDRVRNRELAHPHRGHLDGHQARGRGRRDPALCRHGPAFLGAAAIRRSAHPGRIRNRQRGRRPGGALLQSRPFQSIPGDRPGRAAPAGGRFGADRLDATRALGPACRMGCGLRCRARSADWWGTRAGSAPPRCSGSTCRRNRSWRPLRRSRSLSISRAFPSISRPRDREILSVWPFLLATTSGVILGTAFGARVLSRLPEKGFRRVVAVLLVALGVPCPFGTAARSWRPDRGFTADRIHPLKTESPWLNPATDPASLLPKSAETSGPCDLRQSPANRNSRLNLRSIKPTRRAC